MSEFVQGLRNAADFFESHPGLGVPSDSLKFNYAGKVAGISVDSKEGVRAFCQIVGGKIDKSENELFYYLVAPKDGFTVMAIAYRNAICEKVQVGTKIEPAHVIPAQPATEEQEVPEREVPVYEWRCPSLLKPEEEMVQS